MTTSQVNARIDSTLKEKGDRALSSIGYTPTQAIRSLWEFCSRAGHDKRALKSEFEMLEGVRSADEPVSEIQQRIDRVKEGPLIVERALQEMGVSNPTPSGLSDEELLEHAYREKWADRGL